MREDLIKSLVDLIESSKILKKRLSNIKKELLKPNRFYQKEFFDNFVEDVLFPNSNYTLIRRTTTYGKNRKRFSESTMDPDFLFRCNSTQKEFFVEAKYRVSLKKEKIPWAKLNRKGRYKVIDLDPKRNIPVFIVLGLQGLSAKPKKTFLFPVRKVNYIHLNMDIAAKYELENSSVCNNQLWELIR